MKWGIYAVLVVCVALAWMKFAGTQSAIEKQKSELIEMKNSGEDLDEEINTLENKIEGKENEKTFTGILLAFLTAGLVGMQNNAAYCAAKHGVAGFAKALRAEVAARGVRVSCVYPGPTESPSWAARRSR